jgi:alpha-glucosidase
MNKPNWFPHAIVVALSVFLSPAFAAVQTVGNVTNVTLSVDGTNGNVTANFWINNGGVAAVTPVAADMVRVQYYFTAPLWSKEEPMIAKTMSQWPGISNNISFTDQGATFLVSTPQLDVVVTKSSFKVDFKDKSGFYLSQDDFSQFDSSYSFSGQSGWTSGGFKLKCLKKITSNQAFFGIGEYGGPLNRRGSEFECWNTGTYNWNEFNKPEYLNMPFFYGVQPANGSTNAFVYGIFFNNPCRPLFSFGSSKSGGSDLSFEAGDGQLDYFFFGGGTNHTMTAVMDRYSDLTGRPAMLPKWAFGYQLSRFSYDNQSWVQYLADTATSSNIPLDAVYLDIDYMKVNSAGNATDANNLHQLTMNSSQFPTPASMVSYCGAKGVKIIPLIEPILETADPLYTEANNNLHFIKNNDGSTYSGSIYLGPVSFLDYSSTPMRTWWQGKITNWLSSVPFAGIWNDIDEPEGSDSIPANALLWCDGRYGTSTTDSRRQWSNEKNYFGLRCASTSYGALLEKNPDKRPFILSRSGNCGLQHYAVSWSGDTAANWTYARTCIRFGLSAMISGAAWYGHDLGGFTGTVDPELLTRWHEWGAFLPFYRSHSRKGDDVWPSGDQGREPWRYADPYQSAMRTSIQLRYKMMPYLYTLVYNCAQTGEPMNEPTVAKFYSDSNTASLNDYEFLAGDYLLVAPNYTQGATTRTVYLPYAPGVAWYHWWSNTRYTGGNTVTVSTSLGQVPLFVRSGAIIPMGPTMQSTMQFKPNYLDINCWPEGNSSFTLYEDEGDGWNYTNGVYASVTFNSSRTTTNWDLTIGARQGSYNPGHTNYFVYVYNPDSVSAVKLNGSPLAQIGSLNSAATGWLMTGDGKLAIKVVDSGASQSVHVDWGTNSVLNNTNSYGAMTVAGTFQNPQWNPAASNMVQVTTHIWQLDTTFANLTNLQFKFTANGNWTTNWGENNGSQAQFTVPLSGTGKLGGSSNILATGTFNGSYRFTFNDQTLAYSLVPVLASPYGAMTVAGTFQNPQWSPSLTNMTLVTNSYWQFDTTFLSNTNYSTVTNLQFKFAANGNWNANWGDNSQTQTNPTFGGAGASFGGNISASVTSNTVYRFTFNDSTLVYTLQKLTVAPSGFVGQIILSNQACAFFFTNAPGAPFTVLASTNISLPTSNWLVLGAAVENPPGNYQFTHLGASNAPRFFYRLRSP